ncbi:hypothetical protein [Microbacterium luticocti]|uniref:hypothetical protein n=1 Tax=Microbacterium luticocti TaxID=451764 RepID=UPI0003F76F11|nr:hypothetical protein [Microbacterium luticocti]
MDASGSTPRSVRMTRPTWVWGGICLAGSAVPGLLWQTTMVLGASAAATYLGELLWCAAFVLFAVRRDSVVGRRVSGMVALFALAIWPVLATVVVPALPVFSAAGGDLFGAILTSAALGLVPVALALIAVVQVWRADVVPRGFRWVPTVALVLCTVPGIIPYLPLLTVQTSNGLAAIAGLGTVCRTVGVVGLGVIAIIAGTQPRPVASVAVYPPPTD